jgi:hypothetical protein
VVAQDNVVGLAYTSLIRMGSAGGMSFSYWDHNVLWSIEGRKLDADHYYDNSAYPAWQPPALPGPNDIEADPLFVDAAGNDFRPRNPAMITGGRPVDGVATYMGAVPTKHIKSNARTANFGRMNIIRS